MSFSKTMILVIVFGLAWLIYAIVIASHMNSYYSGISDKVSASKNKLDSIINAQTETDVAINNTLDTEIKNIMSNAKKTEHGKEKHTWDKSGKSYFYETRFKLQSGDSIRIMCLDWSKEKETPD